MFMILGKIESDVLNEAQQAVKSDICKRLTFFLCESLNFSNYGGIYGFGLPWNNTRHEDKALLTDWSLFMRLLGMYDEGPCNVYSGAVFPGVSFLYYADETHPNYRRFIETSDSEWADAIGEVLQGLPPIPLQCRILRHSVTKANWSHSD